MKRLVSAAAGREGGRELLAGGASVWATTSTRLTTSMDMYSPTTIVQRRGLRNLHQYPHARYKSLSKDRLRFSRNWWLKGANNYELVDEKGHEREAVENFGVYRDDSDNDRYVMSTNCLNDLPPAERLNALAELMRVRWMVRDGNRGFDKARMILMALECFSELRLSGQIKVFNELPEPDQDTFLEYVEACGRFAQACSHSHPDAVAVMLRAAAICDEMRCEEKRDDMVHMAEIAARRLDRAYSFARPGEQQVRLNPPTELERNTRAWMKSREDLRERFKGKPWIYEPKPPREFFRGKRLRKIFHYDMKADDKRLPLLQEPARPEVDSWKGTP